MDFKIGDSVEIVLAIETFSQYQEMAAQMNLAHWTPGLLPANKSKGVIVGKEMHPNQRRYPFIYGVRIHDASHGGCDFIVTSSAIKLTFDGVLGGSMMRRS